MPVAVCSGHIHNVQLLIGLAILTLTAMCNPFDGAHIFLCLPGLSAEKHTVELRPFKRACETEIGVADQARMIAVDTLACMFGGAYGPQNHIGMIYQNSYQFAGGFCFAADYSYINHAGKKLISAKITIPADNCNFHLFY